MNRSTDLLRAYATLIQQLSGAEAVSFFVPPGSELEPLLFQEGKGAVPELASLDAAVEFARGRDITSGRFLEEVESTEPNGKLVPVPCAPPPAGENSDPLARTHRRRSRDSANAPEPPGTCWVGLRFAKGARGQARASEALQLLLASNDADASKGDDRSAFLGLAGVLTWYARQASAVLDDPVTGLAGRAEFQTSLRNALARAQASVSPLSLLLINPDDFNSVNENEGHAAGDGVLREIGSRLRAIHRSSDTVAKYGGAIFASFAPDTSSDAARVVAGKLWRKLSERPFLDGSLRLGISVGLAVYEPGDPTVDGPHELIRRADKALHAAKRVGGNQVVEWEPQLESRDIGNVDRLTGLYTGNMAKDYRNMSLLSDTMSAVAGAANVSDLLARVTERLETTLKTERVAIFEELDGKLSLVRELRRSADRSTTLEPANGVHLDGAQRALVEDARRQKRPLLRAFQNGSQDRRVLSFAVPMVLEDRPVGCLYLDGREHTLALEGSTDLGFLRAFATQLAVALDRARLAELSKQQSETEHLRLRAEVEGLREALPRRQLVYCSGAMESLIQTIRRVAPTKATVLVIGESGTGKELVARTLHELSTFKNKPLIVVDCGAIPATLIESELFGHERGAYTGAEEKRMGRLLEAEGGTVVLDEIGELPLEVQSKLLRFVQERQVMPVGGTRVRRVDTRLVAVTHRELAVEAAAGRFREDLFYRLNVVRVTVPPLRERREDILHLAQHFLEQFSKQYQRGQLTYSPEATALMREYGWPGNVRELQHRILQAVILGEGPEIGAAELGLEDLPPEQTVEMDLTALRRVPSKSIAPRPAQAREVVSSPRDAWRDLRIALRRQIDAACSEIGAKPAPLGTWLEEDIVLAAFEAAGRVSGRARALLGVPETTFRRRMRKARAGAGFRLPNPPWEKMAPLISRLVRTAAIAANEDVLQRARSILLNEVLTSGVGVPTGASLMGITARTYRRWTAEAMSQPKSIAAPLYT